MIQKIKNKKYSLERKVYNILGFSKKRNSSYPYISGDTFRTLTKNRYEEPSRTLIPNKVKQYPLVFVESHLLLEFFETIHQKIKNRYVLISHNGDENITEKYKIFIDDKIYFWFAQNCDIEHERVMPIPIGLENAHYHNHGRIKNFNRLAQKNISKIKKILYGFSVVTNPTERSKALDVLSKLEYAEKITKNFNSYDYLKYMQQYIAVASPPGNGLDCHRTWEAMYLGVFPIVKKSIMTEYFKKVGCPLYVVDEYRDLLDKSMDDITYEISMNNKEFLYFDYWNKIILSKLEELK